MTSDVYFAHYTHGNNYSLHTFSAHMEKNPHIETISYIVNIYKLINIDIPIYLYAFGNLYALGIKIFNINL